jgi:hypothetical protein
MGSGGLELSETRRSELPTGSSKALIMTVSDGGYHKFMLEQI